MKIVGVTGGRGTGKTAVCREFEKLGAYIVDADQTARKVVQPGSPVLKDIILEFGKEYANEDGTLNRRKLAQTVFSDESRRLRLNAIMHPAIVNEMLTEAQTALLNPQYKLVCLDAPLLIEGGLLPYCDSVVVVLAPKEDRIKRIMARDSLTEEEAAARIDSQPEDAFYLDRVTYGLSLKNNKSETELLSEARKIFQKLTGDCIGS